MDLSMARYTRVMARYTRVMARYTRILGPSTIVPAPGPRILVYRSTMQYYPSSRTTRHVVIPRHHRTAPAHVINLGAAWSVYAKEAKRHVLGVVVGRLWIDLRDGSMRLVKGSMRLVKGINETDLWSLVYGAWSMSLVVYQSRGVSVSWCIGVVVYRCRASRGASVSCIS